MGNDLTWIGAGGIKVNGAVNRESLRTGETIITDNRILHLGRLFHSGVGVLLMNSFGNTVAHNEVADLYYTGVSVGWVWGYAPSVSRENRIEFNHIHHVGQGLLSDMGAVYTLGLSPGTMVRSNVIHDVAGHDKAWGLYTDEGSTGIVLEDNLVYRTTHGGFHQHYGRDNVVRNNILALGRDAQVVRSRDEPHRSFTFERNIVYYRGGELLSSVWSGGPDRISLDHNMYWNLTGGAAIPVRHPRGVASPRIRPAFDRGRPQFRGSRPRRLPAEARQPRAEARVPAAGPLLRRPSRFQRAARRRSDGQAPRARGPGRLWPTGERSLNDPRPGASCLSPHGSVGRIDRSQFRTDAIAPMARRHRT